MGDKWTFSNNTAWVIAESKGVIGEEWNRMVEDPGCVLTMVLADGGRGLPTFSYPESAEKFIRESGLQNVEPLEWDNFRVRVLGFGELVPDLTCVVLDPIAGYVNV